MTRKNVLTTTGLLALVLTGSVEAQTARELISAARLAARQDHNAEAAELFLKAIQREPARRTELARELADQLTYSGKAPAAIPLYREAVEKGRLSLDDTRRARLGLALALGWSGDLDGALAEYDRLLAENPADSFAQRERVQRIVDVARINAGRNRNQAAAALLERAIRDAPGRRDELLCEWAEQLTYSGKSTDAIPLFREALERAPDAQPARRARLGLALALGWRGQFRSSLREYDVLLAANPNDLEAKTQRTRRLIDAARDAAYHDRNAESATLFETVIRQNPQMRTALAREWADQLTYSGRESDAIPLYREVLASGAVSAAERRAGRLGLAWALTRRGDLGAALAEYDALIGNNPGDVHARLGRARTLSWMDQLSPASKEYEMVLRLDPRNPEAAKGLARVQSWRGRQREAQKKLGEFLSKHPGDAEAAFLLAQSEEWMGRRDRAESTIRNILAQQPDNGEASRRLDALESGNRRGIRSDFSQSTQSDGLTITSWAVAQDLQTSLPRTSIQAVYESSFFAPAEGRGISLRRPGVKLEHRLSDNIELHANAFLEATDPGSGRRVLPTFDTWLTWWPGDALRFDFGMKRATFDNLKSLAAGITATYNNCSMDFRASEKSVFSTRFNVGRYSDGNRRVWGQTEFQYRVFAHPAFTVGARWTGFGFSRTLDNGYFCPQQYQSLAPTAHLTGRIGAALEYDIDGSVGFEDASPGGRRAVHSGGVRIRRRLTGQMDVECRFENFSTRQFSSGGFARTTVAAALVHRW